MIHTQYDIEEHNKTAMHYRMNEHKFSVSSQSAKYGVIDLKNTIYAINKSWWAYFVCHYSNQTIISLS